MYHDTIFTPAAFLAEGPDAVAAKPMYPAWTSSSLARTDRGGPRPIRIVRASDEDERVLECLVWRVLVADGKPD